MRCTRGGDPKSGRILRAIVRSTLPAWYPPHHPSIDSASDARVAKRGEILGDLNVYHDALQTKSAIRCCHEIWGVHLQNLHPEQLVSGRPWALDSPRVDGMVKVSGFIATPVSNYNVDCYGEAVCEKDPI